MTPRERPDVAEMLRPRPEEQLERDGDPVAAAALILGPALALAPIVLLFVPILGSSVFLVDIALLGLAPAVLSLAWRPGGSPSRARSVTIVTTILIALYMGLLGLQANPCAADPTFVGIMSCALSVGTFLAATAVGRQLAIQGGLVMPLVAAGAVGVVGFFVTAFLVLPEVLVLC